MTGPTEEPMEWWRVKVRAGLGGGYEWESYENARTSAVEAQKKHGIGRVSVELRLDDGDPVEMSVDAMHVWYSAKRGVVWERLACFTSEGEPAPAIQRARVPGGWLIRGEDGATPAFVPTPKHDWDGTTLDLWRDELVGIEGSAFWRALGRANR